MVKGSELENRGANIGANIRGVAEAEAEIRRIKGKPVAEAEDPSRPADAVQELATLKARIAQARELRPPHQGVADGRSWGMGRDDALAFLEAPG